MNAPSRRAALAFIALADAPMPEHIDFHPDISDSLSLSLSSLYQVRAWQSAFGGEWAERTQPYQYLNGPLETLYNLSGSWNGWAVKLAATEPVGQIGGDLDEATREQLATVIDRDANVAEDGAE